MKTILLTGATDGIGLETARRLAGDGHRLLLHGRNRDKLDAAAAAVSGVAGAGPVETFLADLSSFENVVALAGAVTADCDRLDVLINNAGVFRTPRSLTASGLDIRFVVNTLAPYLLTRKLLPLMDASGRIVNLSSAAQAPVDLDALAGRSRLGEMEAYSQSKLAITMWTRALAEELGTTGPLLVAVNPGSLLASKMVREGFGVAGSDLGIGADILCRAALDPGFVTATGLYFDNDSGQFSEPHPAGSNAANRARLVDAMDALLSDLVP